MWLLAAGMRWCLWTKAGSHAAQLGALDGCDFAVAVVLGDTEMATVGCRLAECGDVAAAVLCQLAREQGCFAWGVMGVLQQCSRCRSWQTCQGYVLCTMSADTRQHTSQQQARWLTAPRLPCALPCAQAWLLDHCAYSVHTLCN